MNPSPRAARSPEAAHRLRFPFKNPHIAAAEQTHVASALAAPSRCSGGTYSRRCVEWIQSATGANGALLVQSCTAGLELAMVLAGIGPGDEVVMPSFAFPSLANAVVLRGGVPVFVDIRSDTLNLDDTLVEAAIGARTKAIAVIHYAGVCAQMEALRRIAHRHGLFLIEDAAHAFQASYRGTAAGSLGDIGVFSFHDTKDVNCGEGGALTLGTPDLLARARILAEKGTNRSEFLEGRAAHYEWVDVGFSAQPSEITAAVLFAQLQEARKIKAARLAAWHAYHAALAPLEEAGLLRRQIVPADCGNNGHNTYVILPSEIDRARLIDRLKAMGIEATFHFVPLHSSPAGRRYSRSCGTLERTETAAARILRLPLWPGIAPYCAEIAAGLEAAIREHA